MSTARTNRPLLLAWTQSAAEAEEALAELSTSPARLRTRLQHTIFSLRQAVDVATGHMHDLQGARAELREQQELLAGVVRHLPCPYVVTTLEAAVVEVNPAASQILNLSPRGLIGRNLLLFFDDREGWARNLSDIRGSRNDLFRAAMLRPRERVPKSVTARVSLLPTTPAVLQWFILPGSAVVTGTPVAC